MRWCFGDEIVNTFVVSAFQITKVRPPGSTRAESTRIQSKIEIELVSLGFRASDSLQRPPILHPSKPETISLHHLSHDESGANGRRTAPDFQAELHRIHNWLNSSSKTSCTVARKSNGSSTRPGHL